MARKTSGDTTFSRNLERMMRERGLNAHSLSREVGATDTAIRHWLGGTRGVTLRSLRELRLLFGCTWEELLD